MYDQRFYQRIRQHEVISEVIIILYLDGIFTQSCDYARIYRDQSVIREVSTIFHI